MKRTKDQFLYSFILCAEMDKGLVPVVFLGDFKAILLVENQIKLNKNRVCINCT